MKLYYILIREWCCRKYIVESDMGAYCQFFLSREHKYMIRQASARNVEIRNTKQFIQWFESHVSSIYTVIILIVVKIKLSTLPDQRAFNNGMRKR
jgi:hypothetical protein